MKVSRFVFRVDSSRQIGGGHLARCLTLAKGLKEKGAKCTFICRDLMWNLNALIISEGFELIELPRPSDALPPRDKSATAHSRWLEVNWDVDALETSNALNKLKPDWIIVDHYALWQNWHHVVRCCGVKIMVIDDLADRKHDCDLLLDQNLGADKSRYDGLIPSSCATLLGPEYALLRPEFKEYRDASLLRRGSQGKKNVLINFGTGDPGNYISKVLRALLRDDASSNLTISIIFGGLASINEEHEQLISRFSNTVTSYGMVNNMAEILSLSDLVIGAAGSSSWERCCLGVPSILFPVALNQFGIAERLSMRGAAVVLDKQDLSNGDLGRLIGRMQGSQELSKMSKIAASICDGNGLARVIGRINA